MRAAETNQKKRLVYEGRATWERTFGIHKAGMTLVSSEGYESVLTLENLILVALKLPQF